MQAAHNDPVRKRLEAAIAPLWAELEQENMRRVEARAKADPAKHRLSTVFPAGAPLRWRYFDAGKDGVGRSVRFCYSTVRNVAGYFLIWREIRSKKTMKRDRWDSSTSKASAIRTAERMAKEHRAPRSAAE